MFILCWRFLLVINLGASLNTLNIPTCSPETGRDSQRKRHDTLTGLNKVQSVATCLTTESTA